MATDKAENAGAEKEMTKAAFVQSLSSEIPAKDVVAKAAEVGLTISEGYVYEVRSGGPKKPPQAPAVKANNKVAKVAVKKAAPAKPGGGAARKPAPAKKPASKPGQKPAVVVSKKALVLSFPHDMPAKEVVAAAAKQGVKIGLKYVYSVRSEKAASPGAAKTPAARAAGPRPVGVGPASPTEMELVKLAVATGLDRAVALIDGVRGKLDRLLAP